jgi:uncharacterized protein with NRDE domain
LCLILLAWRAHPAYPLLVAANRDEFHARPAAAAAFWSDHPSVLAGRDLEAGGTWMGVARSGRFAAVTNYRGAHEPRAAESRGALVSRFLLSGETAADYVAAVRERGASYSGFNLLVCDGKALWWLSNRDGRPRPLEPGIHGLGNSLLDAPEVDAAKARFAEAASSAVAVETLFQVLEPSRIVHPLYGTRCSTVLLGGEKSIRYAERAFAPGGIEGETVHYEIPAH